MPKRVFRMHWTTLVGFLVLGLLPNVFPAFILLSQGSSGETWTSDALMWLVFSIFGFPFVWYALADRLILSSDCIEHRTWLGRTIVAWPEVTQIIIDKEGNSALAYQRRTAGRGWIERIGIKPKTTGHLLLGLYVENWRSSPVLDHISQHVPGIEVPDLLQQRTPVPTFVRVPLIGSVYAIVLAGLFLTLATRRVTLPLVMPMPVYGLWAGVWLGTLFSWRDYMSSRVRYATREVILGRGISLYLYPITGALAAVICGWAIAGVISGLGARFNGDRGIVGVLLGAGLLWPSLQDRIFRVAYRLVDGSGKN